MSPPKKQWIAGEGEEIQESTQELVQCELEGRAPEDCDHHGIKLLLHQLFLKARLDLSSLTNLIISQHNVGSVLKQSYHESDEEEDDEMEDTSGVFGITSVINLSDPKEEGCAGDLRRLLVELSSEHGTEACASLVRALLSDSSRRLGLVINERIINISPAVSVPLLESLLGEMEKAQRKNKGHFEFTHFVFICKVKKADGKAAKKIKKNPQAHGEIEEIIWENGEEEIIDQEADCRFEFSVKDETDSGLGGRWSEDDVPMTPYRRVLILSSDKLRGLVSKIRDAVSFDPSCLLHTSPSTS